MSFVRNIQGMKIIGVRSGGGGGAEQIEGGTELIKVDFIGGGTSTVEKQGVRIIYRKRDYFYMY